MEADRSIIIKTEIDDKQAQAELNRLAKKIDTLNEKIADKKQEQMPLVAKANELIVALDAAKAKLAEMQNGATPYTKDAIKKQTDEVKRLQALWNDVQNKVERLGVSIQKDTIELERSQDKAGNLSAQLAGAADNTNGMSEAAKRAEKNMGKFLNRVKGLAKRVFIFTLITKALRAVKDYVWKSIQTNEEAMESVAKFKGALQILAQPILKVLIPAFTLLVNTLTRVITAISSFISMISGSTLAQSAEAAENLYNEQKALSGVGGAAEKASKSLASFDKINQLSPDSSSSSDSSAGSTAPDFKGSIQDQLNGIVGLFAGAALLALGAILAFSGIEIPLGIGLMAAGAMTIAGAVATDWDGIKTMLQGSLGGIVALISGALLVLGAILAFSGVNTPLGIGLMAAGAVGLVSVVAANWSRIPELLKGTLGDVTAALSVALLALGAILAFTGVNLPLGIGLMAAGAVGLAALAVVNWDSISAAMQGPIGGITALVSTALIVLGAVLLFTGAGIPLGLGLIAAGGVGLAASIVPNWDFILEKLKSAWSAIKNWWNTTVINGFSHAKEAITGFGSGVIEKLKNVLGIHSPSTETAAMGDYMMQGMTNGIADSQYMVLDAFQAVMDSLTLSYQTWQTNFMAGFSAFRLEFTSQWSSLWSSSAYSFVNSWNSILNSLQIAVNNAVSGLNRLIGAANALSILTGKFYTPVNAIKIDKVPIPKLASGGVIPPNREFLAVLGDQKQGTNIETPLRTMIQAFRMALSEGGYGGHGEAVLEVDGDRVGKLIYRLNKSESTRIGVDLTEG